VPDDTSRRDPIAARSDALVRWFTRYLRWTFSRRFHALRVSRSGPAPVIHGKPLIVFTNHPSWWDPAIYFILNAHLFPGRRGFGPMDEEALDKYALMKRLGVFPVTPTPRGVTRFLTIAASVLADDRDLLWITAEGHFTDVRKRPVRLRPGIAHLARRIDGVAIVPMAVEYTFWNESKPEVLLRFGTPIMSGAGQSVAAWIELLEAELERTMDALATESITRDPLLFETLSRSRVGVGGPYDLWRAFKARKAGRVFDPSHEGREP
jgi:1-acyl-sn-glycerol-3-phosphate acyltransferase